MIFCVPAPLLPCSLRTCVPASLIHAAAVGEDLNHLNVTSGLCLLAYASHASLDHAAAVEDPNHLNLTSRPSLALLQQAADDEVACLKAIPALLQQADHAAAAAAASAAAAHQPIVSPAAAAAAAASCC